MSYVKAAKELPKMNEDEIEQKSREYGFRSADEESRHGSTSGSSFGGDEKTAGRKGSDSS